MTEKKSLEALPTDDWDASLAGVIDDMSGQPLNVHGLMANNPALLKAWWEFRMHIVSAGSLGKRNAELVILRTAVHSGAQYEWLAHVDRGHAAGLSLEEIERVMEGPDAEGWEDADALLLLAVDELAANKGLQPETRDRVADMFGDAATLDLIAIHGTYVMLACMLNTWDIELDDAIVEKLRQLGYQ